MSYLQQKRIAEVYDEKLESLKLQVVKEPDVFIIGTDTEELVNYYLPEPIFAPIEYDEELSENAEIKKEIRTIRASDRDPAFRSMGDKREEYEILRVSIPLKVNQKMRELIGYRSNSFSLSWVPSEAEWKHNEVSFQVDIKGYGFSKSDDQVQSDVEFQRNQVRTFIRNMSESVNVLNTDLKSKLTNFVDQRREKLKADKDRYNSLLKKIDIPLKKKEDGIVKKIQVDPKPLIQKVRPNPKLPEEYQLDREKVLGIIHILDNQGRQLEKTPGTFANSKEEDLRNVLLVGVNTVFEGKATGETFMNHGKTDIYLNIDRGNILVFECKIWSGQKNYGETIDQLVSYLTWRQNYGVVISFVRNKNMSHVIAEAKTAIQNHPLYKRGFKEVADSHFISHHVLPTDNEKEVEIHHLFYNLFIE